MTILGSGTSCQRLAKATHDEWTVRQILVHLGLFSDIKSLRADITNFHARQGIVQTDVKITSFYSLRPDGVAFDDKNKHCVLLEFTRPMDSCLLHRRETGLRERNARRMPDTECTFTSSTISALFMVVLGTVHKPTSQREHGAPSNRPNQFQDRLRLLGVTNSKVREKIRVLTVSKTLALSDIILKLFHVSILRSPE